MLPIPRKIILAIIYSLQVFSYKICIFIRISLNMYKLLVFRLFLHYILGRAVDTCDFAAVYGSWHDLCLLCPGLQELRNTPGFLPLYSVSLPAKFFLHKMRMF